MKKKKQMYILFTESTGKCSLYSAESRCQLKVEYIYCLNSNDKKAKRTGKKSNNIYHI